jgi:HAMP domain-containing protein
LEPLERLKSLLLLLTLASITASIIGSVVLARRITHPLAALTQFAKRVRDGDYTGRIEIDGGDEVGAVATSFNHMLEGIAAREAEVMRLAYQDTLTGLPNRAMFNDRLAQAVKLYRRSKSPVSVLSWTWTGSSTSTIPWGMAQGTSCYRRSRSGCATQSGSPIPSRGLEAMSLESCSLPGVRIARWSLRA